MSERINGVVRWFNQARGYGYINGDDGSEARVARDALDDGTFVTEGMRVTYVAVADGDGTLEAQHVRIAG